MFPSRQSSILRTAVIASHLAGNERGGRPAVALRRRPGRRYCLAAARGGADGLAIGRVQVLRVASDTSLSAMQLQE